MIQILEEGIGVFTPFQYIYGPVNSWRLGRSLGIDPLSTQHKICNMDCVYCQLGRTAALTHERKIYVQTEDVIKELERIPIHYVDYLTFAGRGEPTLAKNLGRMIREIKDIRREKIAVLTNSSLMDDGDVQQELMTADFILAKLDVPNQLLFGLINGSKHFKFNNIVQGLIDFRQQFKGELALQIMLIDPNISSIQPIADLCQKIMPHEIQLDTPLRPSAVKALERSRIEWAKSFFKGMPFSVVTVFDAPIQESTPFDEAATISRHGNFRKTRCIH